MVDLQYHVALILLLPLAGALLNGLYSFLGLPLKKWFVSLIACGALLGSFVLSLLLFQYFLTLPEAARTLRVVLFPWVHLGTISIDVSLWVDPLTLVMMLVVTGVGFLIHLYSIGYMAHDKGFARFFAYLNLFCFMMLLLVMGDNLAMMFIGWEGVGLCSYLLIGFWFHHKPNAVAGMKAFIVNRVGDFGFLVGLMILYAALTEIGHPTLTFSEIRDVANLLANLTFAGIPVVTLVTLCFFVGATGKSAQIPLYVWLPDAMAGPTPVSALIHAATMVTAGVYMIGRLSFLYVLSPVTLGVVAVIGMLTAFYAGTIALTQNDIKKVLAYSTISQLGYMFAAMGAASFAFGIFHLVTHAFFKACLFLAAGSVIHAMSGGQDMRQMGGLAKKIPLTFATFLLAALALTGIFPFAGFFSKDEILSSSFHQSPFLWALGLAGALLTGFYTFRMVAMTFFGKNKSSEEVQGHIHESPISMTSVLVVLGFLSLVGGLLGVSPLLSQGFRWPFENLIGHWLAPVFNLHPEAHSNPTTEMILMGLSLFIVLVAAGAGLLFFTKRLDIPKTLAEKYKNLHRLLVNKYFVDELYNAIFVQGLLRFEQALARFDHTVIDGAVNLSGWLTRQISILSGWVDQRGVDGTVNFIANETLDYGQKLQRVQSGQIQSYVYVLVLGMLVLLAWKTIF